jgi:hypothetical protein
MPHIPFIVTGCRHYWNKGPWNEAGLILVMLHFFTMTPSKGETPAEVGDSFYYGI